MRLDFRKLSLLGGKVARGVAKLVRLTPVRLEFLQILFAGAKCQREIAAVLCCSAPVVSRLVRALVALGFVERFVPLRDRRFRIVQLTEKGRWVCRRMVEPECLLGMADEGAHRSGDDVMAYWLHNHALVPHTMVRRMVARNAGPDEVEPHPGYDRLWNYMRRIVYAPHGDDNLGFVEPRIPKPPPRGELVPDPQLRPPPARSLTAWVKMLGL